MFVENLQPTIEETPKNNSFKAKRLIKRILLKNFNVWIEIFSKIFKQK